LLGDWLKESFKLPKELDDLLVGVLFEGYEVLLDGNWSLLHCQLVLREIRDHFEQGIAVCPSEVQLGDMIRNFALLVDYHDSAEKVLLVI